LTRYPVMEFSDAAKARLIALHQAVPRPTKAALAQNKAEDAARRQQTTMNNVMGIFQRHPDVTAATKVGEPALVDPEPISAGDIVQKAQRVAVAKTSAIDTATVTTAAGTGAPPASEPAPRSDVPAAVASTSDPATQPAQPDPNELKPGAGAGDPNSADPGSKNASDPNAVAAAPDPNELKPDVAPTDQPTAAPVQVNEIQPGATPAASSDTASSQDMASDKDVASSKHKKKKGLSKYIPLPKPQ